MLPRMLARLRRWPRWFRQRAPLAAQSSAERAAPRTAARQAGSVGNLGSDRRDPAVRRRGSVRCRARRRCSRRAAARQQRRGAAVQAGSRGAAPVFSSRRGIDDPMARCLLTGVPRINFRPLPFEIVQLPDRVIMLYEIHHAFRIIPTDGRPPPEDAEPSYLGESVAHWDGDTLVVDVTSFNDQDVAFGRRHDSHRRLYASPSATRATRSTRFATKRRWRIPPSSRGRGRSARRSGCVPASGFASTSASRATRTWCASSSCWKSGATEKSVNRSRRRQLRELRPRRRRSRTTALSIPRRDARPAARERRVDRACRQHGRRLAARRQRSAPGCRSRRRNPRRACSTRPFADFQGSAARRSGGFRLRRAASGNRSLAASSVLVNAAPLRRRHNEQ